ncbi:MAG TPA: MMPL family transporter [Burkholderiaceae bacterium]|nr:MMPL family transporter [Burkholderiaceae bacterium]
MTAEGLLRTRGGPVLLWLALCAVAAVLSTRVPLLTDMSAFLPRQPTAEQRVLLDSLREGPASRLLLIGIDAVPPAKQAALSDSVAAAMRASGRFAWVGNGRIGDFDAEQAWLFQHRYLLSPRVDAEMFGVGVLQQRLRESIAGLAGVAGLLPRELWLRDPTGEFAAAAAQLAIGESAPHTARGVWVSRDRALLLLMAQVAGAGADLDAQQRALAALERGFERVRSELNLPQARLLLSGAPVFAVQSREAIRDDVTRLGVLGLCAIAALLTLFFRSPLPLALATVPLVSAVLAGAAAVAVAFGAIHGLTLGFGIALVGEAVDYALYTLGRSARAVPGEQLPAHERVFWSTVRLGVLTSIAGFAALLLSGFPGLAQMAVFSIFGLIAAALTARFVLPALTPPSLRSPDRSRLERRLRSAVAALRRLRWPLAALALAAAAVVALRAGAVWDADLASLNPIARAATQLHERLQHELGAPDAGRFVVVSAGSDEAVLQALERLQPSLDALVERAAIAGYDSPARLLPSRATQLQRLAALPPPDVLQRRLEQATEGLPLRAQRLAPFVDDVAAARARGPIDRSDLGGSALALRLDSLLIRDGERSTALVPLRSAPGGAIDVAAVRSALPEVPTASVTVLDVRQQTDRLYRQYLREAIVLSLLGAAAIVGLLAAALRDPSRLARVCAPLAAAVLLVVAAFALAQVRLNLLHLIGLLLVVAVGSNYALFFAMQAGSRPSGSGMLSSLLFANLTTVAAFGVLSTSAIPLLSALGATVAAGAALALALAGAWSAADAAD